MAHIGSTDTDAVFAEIDVSQIVSSALQSDTSVAIDIDNNSSSSTEQFTVTQDGGASDIFRANEGGLVEIPNGNLTVGGTSVTLDSRFPIPNSDLTNSSVTVAGNSVSLGGSTGVAHSDLTGIGSADHHTKYADSDAVSAINAETSLSVDISGDADTVDGYDIQKNGTDGSGIINFKTT